MIFHSKHHVTHPSKNVPSAGKGSLGAAPVGKGILSDAAAGKGVLGNVPFGLLRNVIVPPPSYHRKPSAALYGDTTQLKKSAVPVNLPHKTFAGGDGHPLRKPVVHAGIPHAKKLPASDKTITVRCTWSNRDVSQPTRTVTQLSPNEQSASSQMYRAPTPPQCAADVDYPSGCQDDVRQKLERMRLHAPQEALVLFYFIFILYDMLGCF